MKIKIIRNTVADGKDVFEGDTLDVEHSTAQQLLAARKAVPLGENGEGESPSTETAHIVPKDHAAGEAEDASADPARNRKGR